MRRWSLLAGLAVAILVVVLLVIRAGKPPSPGAPDHASIAPAPHPVGPIPAPGVGAGPSPSSTPAAEGAPSPMDFHEQPVDEGTRAIRAYQITWKRLETYVAAVAEIRRAGEGDAALLARLRQPSGAGEQPASIAARLEAIAPVKAILRRHDLTGLDLVLMPHVVALGQNCFALEQEGRAPPASAQNLAATALYREDLPRMDALAKAFRADLRFLGAAGASTPR